MQGQFDHAAVEEGASKKDKQKAAKNRQSDLAGANVKEDDQVCLLVCVCVCVCLCVCSICVSAYIYICMYLYIIRRNTLRRPHLQALG